MILDHFKLPARFHATSVDDVFAITLARRLNDEIAVRQYAEWVDRRGQADMLATYLKASQNKGASVTAETFRAALKHPIERFDPPRHRLLAIRVTRRAVSVAIFHGEHLEFAQCRQLMAASERALSSALAFIMRVLTQFPCETVATESIDHGPRTTREHLIAAIQEQCRGNGTTIWQVSWSDIFSTLGVPALRSRDEARAAISSLWPILSGEREEAMVQDAAAIGVHVQVERLFIN